MYNETAIFGSLNPVDLITALNNETNSLLIGVFMFTLYFVMFLTFKNYQIKIVMTGISFIMVIISGLLYTFGWIGWYLVLIPIIIFLASLIAIRFIE